MEERLEVEFDEEYKERLLNIIKRSIDNGASLSSAEAVMLFHWKRHENDPAYDFVPEEFRGYR